MLEAGSLDLVARDRESVAGHSKQSSNFFYS